MARIPRVVVLDVPHHVTQRGNARQVILANDSDCITYLELLRQNSGLYRLGLLGYCLMPNHVHLIAVPATVESLAQTLKHTHGRYASYWNACQSSSGHVWQGRFYSCPLDDSHLWAALRYVELNPVRAGLVAAPQQWRWSSAVAHCAAAASGTAFDASLEMERWRKRWTVAEWSNYLASGESPADLHELRRSTHSGRPLGTPDFVEAIERSILRRFAPGKRGRPRKSATDSSQHALAFVA